MGNGEYSKLGIPHSPFDIPNSVAADSMLHL